MTKSFLSLASDSVFHAFALASEPSHGFPTCNAYDGVLVLIPTPPYAFTRNCHEDVDEKRPGPPTLFRTKLSPCAALAYCPPAKLLNPDAMLWAPHGIDDWSQSA